MQDLQIKLGYEFADARLRQLALTHRSASKHTSYERLEFLGDALLSAVIADVLYDRFASEQEGRLTRMRATLVRQETLAKVAGDLQLSQHLHLGAGELKAGGRKRASILSDVVEALIGAIYLDSGDFVTVKRVVSQWFSGYIDCIDELAVLKDSKSRLQELLQSTGKPLPAYALEKVDGKAPNEVFFVTCTAADKLAHATGKSRRIAEQEAAKLMLEQLASA